MAKNESAAQLLNRAKNAVGDRAVAASVNADRAGRRDDLPEARRENARARLLSAIAVELTVIERRLIEAMT